jgi:hypothetical protein
MTDGTSVVTTPQPADAVSVSSADIAVLFEKTIGNVRDDVRDNPYIAEALRVLPVGGYRSAIGSFWNAVVDDLRKKIEHRSLALFNKSVAPGHEIRTYEDFQNYVNDDQLIDGAYKIGVIGWEASKILRHAKETRHIFDGHPKSSEPSPLKVLAMMEDCVKYVLNDPYPTPVIDLDEYIAQLGESKFDRNDIAVENALGDLPDVYRTELINRLFTAYVADGASSVLLGNIAFAAPFLWRVLPKADRHQVVRRVDQVIAKGNAASTAQAFAFVQVVDGAPYLSASARAYAIEPLITKLEQNLDQWTTENETVRDLALFKAVVPPELVSRYVAALTKTYVGYTGGSAQYSRTDFYANGAAQVIPGLFESFDDRAADAFIDVLRADTLLRSRLQRPAKLNRLRALGRIVLDRVSGTFPGRSVLDVLADDKREPEFWAAIGVGKPPVSAP